MVMRRNNVQLAQEQWDRYTTAMDRGHLEYQEKAKRNEDFYLGDGAQWSEDLKKLLEAEGKPWLEENLIFSSVNTVLGYQTQSRMDIAYKPRENGDQAISDLLTKIGMFIVDQNKFPWKESNVFADGLIQRRGFYDIRMNFDENMFGDIEIKVLDPLDVIPDPDSKSYDPCDWNDVIVTQWVLLDDIKETYGLAKWRKVAAMVESEPDFGADGFGIERNKFGTISSHSSYFADPVGKEHVRVLERQWYKLQLREFFFDLESGDLYPVPSEMSVKDKNNITKNSNVEIIKKLVKRVRWTVTTKDVVLHDEWSPYDDFTIIPYFPYFRRGVSVGLVDNLIKTQEMLNKVFSQIQHIVNTTANSGWIVWENSLTNIDIDELESVGAQTGLVLEVRTGRDKPEKIEPNAIPQGLKDLLNTGIELFRMISGVSETFQGGKGPEVSGVAIQSRVHQSAIQLATPLDNLFRTRNLVAKKLLQLVQQFYTEERTFYITSDSGEENPQEETVSVNIDDGSGKIINDITVGRYDVVISDVPTQVTFQNAQFAQAIEMRKYGINIPDAEMIKMSTLARKNEIAKQVSGEMSDEMKQMQQRQFEAAIAELEAKVAKLESDALKARVEAYEKAATIATTTASNPGLSELADNIIDEAEDEIEPEEQQLGQF